ncbi:MAG: type II toxin-antitoxin system VapC family toxin [bacterium]
MTRTLLPDTDVLVDFLRGHGKAVAYVRNHAQKMVLSSIVVAELYAGVKGDEELRKLDRLVSLFPVLPVTPELARAGGLYKRDFCRSHGVGLADAIIAATAETHRVELKTLNTKHYPMLKGLKAPYTKK